MSTNSLAVVILAAGKGTRMKSDLPKVMHPLAGLPMIKWLIRSAEELAPDRIVVVTGPDMPDLEQAAKPHKTVVQPERNGTAGAAIAALPALEGFDGDVLILLGDAPLVSAHTMQALIDRRHAAKNIGVSALGFVPDNPFGYGRLVVTKDERLKKIVEEKDATDKQREGRLCNAGAFCVDGKRLGRWLKSIDNVNVQKEYYLTDLPQMAAKDDVLSNAYITHDASEVQGCNSRADLAALEKTLQQRLRKSIMESGVTMQDPDTVYLHHDTKIGADTFVGPSVCFGPGVEVGAGAEIKAFCHLEGAKIGDKVTVGPFARVRPGSTIGDDVRIGNFVEIKKSSIGKGSKISHLAYVGDCLMGDDVNFSCGAVTVNYDGFEKHQTVIGKNVMVGSNVNLIAPIKVDDGAFIAAGSTINEDVPADALSLARSKNTIREGWAAAFRKKIEDARKKRKAS